MTNLTEELRELHIALQLVLRPTVSIEVGAWQAEFSHEIKNKLPEIDAWAFEANEYNYKANVANAYKAGVHYTNMAITNFSGTTRFMMQEQTLDGRVYGKEIGNNSLLQRTEGNIIYHAPHVVCTTLDAFFIESERVTATDRICLWIDVEGASKEVLTASKTLLSQTQSVFIEVEHTPFWDDQWLFNDVDKFMREYGFESIAHDNQTELQNNHLYLKTELINHIKVNELITSWYRRVYGTELKIATEI